MDIPWRKENCNEIRWLPDERTRAVPLRRPTRRALEEDGERGGEGGGGGEKAKGIETSFFTAATRTTSTSTFAKGALVMTRVIDALKTEKTEESLDTLPEV